MSEHMNRTIVERALCLLFQANLETKLWAEAAATAVYLRNRTVASGLHKKTPYEIWTGHKPDLSNVRVFGSTAMVHIHKAKRTKFEKKSRKCFLIGFNEDVKGYRLFNPENNTVITSRDVIIIEKEKEEKILTCIENNEVQDSVGSETDEIRQDQKNEECELVLDSVSHSNDSDYVPEAQEATVEMQEGATRRSTREPKPKKFPDYVTYMSMQSTTTTNLKSDPTTVKEALSELNKEEWKRAMFEELQSFKENEAWELGDPPEQVNVIECKWVYKKYDSENKVSFRARLVAKSFTQVQV